MSEIATLILLVIGVSISLTIVIMICFCLYYIVKYIFDKDEPLLPS